jgi:hypothetical protein
MRKFIVLLAAFIMALSVSAFAAEDAANPNLEKAKELRVQATKLSLQAAELNKQAAQLELETLNKPGEKMRGFSVNCTSDCVNESHGDFYSCKQACADTAIFHF